MFSLLTALVPLILDKKNKESIYSALHQIVFLAPSNVEFLRKSGWESKYKFKSKRY